MNKMAELSHTVAPYVGGKRCDTGLTTDIVDLTSGDPFITTTCTDQGTADAAVASAASGLQAIEDTTITQRAQWFKRIADGLRNRREELTDVLVRECGKPISSARAEVEHAAERFEYIAMEIHSLSGEYRAWTSPVRAGINGVVRSAPLGIVVCRPAADSPLGTAALQVAPALAVGNSVVLQPAKTTPAACSIFTDIISDTGLPGSGINFVPEPNSVASETLSTHDGVDAIVQSGRSDAVGHAQTGDGIVRLRMTLDQTAPVVVLDDAAITDAASATATGTLTNPGHRNPGLTSVIAHESLTDELITALDKHMETWSSGDLFDESTDVAPLVDQVRLKRLDELVTNATDRGATIVRGGSANGRFYEPTLLVDVPQDAKIHAEGYGPIIAVTSIGTEAEARSFVTTASQSRGPCVFTDSHDRAMAFADAVGCQMVRINGATDRGPVGGIVGTTASNANGLNETFACFTRRKRVLH